MKKIFFFAAALSVLLGILFFAASFSSPETQELAYEQRNISIGGHVFSVQIADTDEKRTRGLSGRETLGESEGMLFVFPEPSYPVFWMKDMRIPIDIIWIDEEQVVGFFESVPPSEPSEPLELYRPPRAVRYVLEVKAGTVRALGIEAGAGFTKP